MLVNVGKILVSIGALLVFSGLIFWFFPGKISWFGNLVGDIKIERENFKFYFPLATMILVSIVPTVLLWIVRKIFLSSFPFHS